METVALKLVVTGPFAAGKTTLVRTMSEIPVIGTETSVSDETADVKANTTVSFDFGKLTLADEDLRVELSLYGTPGQERFAFMWDVLAVGMDGFVVLADGSRPDTFAETARIVAHFRERSPAPFVVGVNKVGPDADLTAVAEAIGAPDAPVLACDVTDQDSARDLLLAALEAVLEAQAVLS